MHLTEWDCDALGSCSSASRHYTAATQDTSEEHQVKEKECGMAFDIITLATAATPEQAMSDCC